VIVPDRSVGGIEGSGFTRLQIPYTPPILIDTVVIPNGEVDTVRSMINERIGGYGRFFRFYDQGYSSVRETMTNLFIGLTWIFAFSSVGWVVAVIIFSLYFIKRKRPESVLLHAIGIGKAKRFKWIFIQSAVIIILAQGIAVVAIYPQYETIMDTVISTAKDFTNPDRYVIFSDSEDAEGIRNEMPINKDPLAPVVAAGIGMVLLLAIAAKLTEQVSTIESLNTRETS
jgi:hypothetical protein